MKILLFIHCCYCMHTLYYIYQFNKLEECFNSEDYRASNRLLFMSIFPLANWSATELLKNHFKANRELIDEYKLRCPKGKCNQLSLELQDKYKSFQDCLK